MTESKLLSLIRIFRKIRLWRGRESGRKEKWKALKYFTLFSLPLKKKLGIKSIASEKDFLPFSTAVT